MKKKEKDDKAKPKKVKKAPAKPEKEAQGFLLPKDYKMFVQWKVTPIFRATFLILLLTLLYAVILIPRWIFTTEWEKAISDLGQTSLEESEWVAAALTRIRPIRNKYREIEKILQFRRIPISPILSAIQKNIPEEISLNSLTWESSLDKTTDNIQILGRRNQGEPPINHTARKATITLEIFATARWNREKSPAGWLANVEKSLADIGVSIKERNIGKEKPFVPMETTSKKGIGEGGSTITVTLVMELQSPKVRETTLTKTLPQRPLTPNLQKTSN